MSWKEMQENNQQWKVIYKRNNEVSSTHFKYGKEQSKFTYFLMKNMHRTLLDDVVVEDYKR